MEIKELGEFGLIERLTKDIEIKNPSTLKSAGDDCAVHGKDVGDVHHRTLVAQLLHAYVCKVEMHTASNDCLHSSIKTLHC